MISMILYPEACQTPRYTQDFSKEYKIEEYEAHFGGKFKNTLRIHRSSGEKVFLFTKNISKNFYIHISISSVYAVFSF